MSLRAPPSEMPSGPTVYSTTMRASGSQSSLLRAVGRTTQSPEVMTALPPTSGLDSEVCKASS